MAQKAKKKKMGTHTHTKREREREKERHGGGRRRRGMTNSSTQVDVVHGPVLLNGPLVSTAQHPHQQLQATSSLARRVFCAARPELGRDGSEEKGKGT